MDLQRIHIKLLSDAPATLSLAPFIAIFGRWRGEKDHPSGWVDLADYAHVPRGPGIVLVGFRANFAFDMADPAPGTLYAAKKGLSGAHAERITAALKSCLELSQRLVAEKEFPPGVHLNTAAWEIHFTDRLETPHAPAAVGELRPAVEQALNRLLGPGGYELLPQSDPSQAPGFAVRAKCTAPLDALLQRLS